MRPINRALLGVARRAERVSASQLIASFVDVGALTASLTTQDHQVIYGRRGTGKTHVLAILAAEAERRNHLPLQLDLRTLGSTGGIYSDYSLPLAERATRLVSDLLWAVHDGVMERALDDETIDLSLIQRSLDALRDSISEVRVVGQVTHSDALTTGAAHSNGADASVALSAIPRAQFGIAASSTTVEGRANYNSVTGDARHRIHFGDVTRRLSDLCESLGEREIWLLLDEWSEIPLDLQPYLADLLRRTVFPVRKMVVKIAAIEQRTNFRVSTDANGYIGIEIGADAAASLTLDDFMVFDNNAAAATSFFKALLWKHVAATAEQGTRLSMLTESEFTSEAFTQISVLQELVRAAEGVPRDAINIASLAAQAAVDRNISVPDIRAAARQWYQQSKENAVASREWASELLQWIREVVIGARRARAFLLPSNTKDNLIEYLYDSRVLHVIKKGVSSNDTPGIRYNVYAIDYGCYVDLISTTNAPQGLFQADEEGVDEGNSYVEVPATDYRSIRRAILDLSEFSRRR